MSTEVRTMKTIKMYKFMVEFTTQKLLNNDMQLKYNNLRRI